MARGVRHRSPAESGALMLTVQAPSGLPEVTAGADLSALLMPLLGGLAWPDGSVGVADTDIVVLASKVVAKAEGRLDRKSTRLNSSHVSISYAVFCLKKKKRNEQE